MLYLSMFYINPQFFFFAALINWTCLHMKHMTNWKECCSWLSTNVLRDLVLLNSKRHPEIVLHTKRFTNTSLSAGCRTNTFYKCRITKSAINGDIDAVLWMKLLYYVLLWKEGACQALYRDIYISILSFRDLHTFMQLINISNQNVNNVGL